QVNYAARLSAVHWPATVARGKLAMLEFDEQGSLPRLDVPTLVIGGEHDPLTTPQASDRIDQLAPHSVETTIPAGHLGLWERHEQVEELLQEFLEKVATRPKPAEAPSAAPSRANLN